MYLKSLQLVGFKSFAEKTQLEFLPGVTAVVGPNGCGKSNIADAIRWVLGEQSAKALRGSEMADVIFNGTDGRKAISMAEVSMTFADVDPKTLSLPGVNLDFSEITITRRVYRDGQGEYLINKTVCRLRDIQGLFMDTGMGRSSYSIMAQGQIDQILSAHPEDRRNIFEEAAGINKYKHQKKEALRKLEYTEANLVRITDIIKEVKRQIVSLQRQAGKARRYKELFDQLKGLETRLARHKFDLLNADITSLESQLTDFAGKADEFAAAITGSETQVTELRRSLSEIEHAINDAVSGDHELKSEADRHQQRIGSHTERITEYEQSIVNHHREIAGSEERIAIQEQDLSRLTGEFDQIAGQLAAEQGKLQAQQDELKQLEGELSRNNRALDETKAALISLESENASRRNELGALDHKKKHDVIRFEKLSTERLQLAEHGHALKQRLDAFNTGLIELRSSVESLRAALAERSAAAAAVAQQLTEATGQHHASVTDLSQKTARLEVLRQLFAAPDGRTTLGQILDVDPAYGAAIEAALSHAIHTILADDLNAARELLVNGQKNPSVVAPELLGGSRFGATETTGTDGHAEAWPSDTTIAINVVRLRDARFEPLVRSLLRNVVIADDLDAALAIRASNSQFSVATKRGEFISDHGILSAVSSSHIAEIATLSEETNRLRARTEELAAGKSALESAKTNFDRDLAKLRADSHAQEVSLAGKEGELNALTTEQRDLDSKIHTVVFELTAIDQQDTEEKQRRAEIHNAMQEAETREQQLRGQIVTAQQAVNDLVSRKEGMTHQLTELRISVGGIEHKREAIEAQREPIAGRLRDLRERMQTCTNEIASYTAKIAQFKLEIAESEQKITELNAAREQSQQQLAGLRHQRGEVATGIEHAEAELKALRQQASDALQQKSAFDLQLAQKRMEIQSLKERVFQKYQVNIEEVRSDMITVTLADVGPTVSEQVPMEVDWDALEAQVVEIQSRLDAMGPVNVESINEFEELEQRYNFLSQQHEDLVKAKEQLLQVIAKINVTTRQLFQETFEKVRQNFQVMYGELFGGGKANLILLDENDPLESGIEIVAKPPGKQLQSITLLSGGEKTMTATALLFAIYMVKPSPFCVLDELDAPLDESNINRFIRILQRFITQSQFVIITHNKRTIGMADALYGITMEEHGISKVVSVKFSPREETERKQLEKVREQQEDRIDGSASVSTDGATEDKSSFGTLPHEEPLRNDLLTNKEQTVAEIGEAEAVNAPQSMLGQAPPAIADEVKAAVAAAVAVSESVNSAVPETDPIPVEQAKSTTTER